MEIRDTRNGSWYWVNTAVNACPHITNADKVVYGALCTFAGYAEIHPSYPEISKRSAVSIRTCKSSISNLIKSGYLSVEKGGGKGNANVYILLKVPKGCKICTVSKGCEDFTQRVQNLQPEGAKSAPQLDNELNKINIVAEATKFDFLKELEKLRNEKRKDLRLIAFFW